MTNFVKILIAAFFTVKLLNFTIAHENENPGQVKLELDHKSEEGDGILVINKPTEFGVQKPYTKFVLFQDDQDTFYNVGNVSYKGKNIKVEGWKIIKDRVYDAYTYWNGERLLLFAFRYSEPEHKSRYMYYMYRSNKWELVDGEGFQANSFGLISVDNLTELLRWIEGKDPTKREQIIKEDWTRITIILVGVVLGILAVLLLAALLLFLKR